MVDTFETDAYFQFDPDGRARHYTRGSRLVALNDGLGQKRGHPDFRRFQALGQLVLDPGDPINFARQLGAEPWTYSNGDKTGANALIVSTIGDTSVPTSTGAAYARAAGLIDYRTPDPRYGKPANQVLVDNFVMEGVNNLPRYVDPAGTNVHIDVENFSNGTDMWGTDVPRLAEPFRLPLQGPEEDPQGISGAVFPMSRPTGQHVFDMPGSQIERARRNCRNACTLPGPGDPCDCETLTPFDIGNFMIHMVGRYLKSGGTFLSDDMCQSRGDCADRQPPPALRDPADLDP